MKAVVQRVRDAHVSVEGAVTGSIAKGLLVYLGVGKADGLEDIRWLAEKIAVLRIFQDDEGKMNRSVQDISGGVLVISQFTLFADTAKGRRPSYNDAADPEAARSLYVEFTREMAKHVSDLACGVFGADMDVCYTNEGPVTIILDTKAREKPMAQT